MSGYELKNREADTSKSLAWSDPAPIDAKAKLDGFTSDVAEILSSRFDRFRLLSIHDDVAFYEARALGTAVSDRHIILKVLRQRGDRTDLSELFQLEALAAARLSHQNVIRSNPPEEFHGLQFSVAPSRTGVETLASLLDRGGWLELPQAVAFAHQIADALDHAHRIGVLHLRLNPENILIDVKGTVLVADFGIEARPELSWAHRLRAASCPIHYASPEQAAGRALDSRSDLYSLGVVLYQMLTDRLPFGSEHLAAVGQKHLTQTPLAPHLYCSDVPLSVSAVVSRLLEKDPNRRFQDVASFRAELDGFVNCPSGIVDIGEASPELSSETEDNTDPAPLAEDSLMSAATSGAREAWDPPTITVIDPPIAESSGTISGTEAVIESEAQAKPLSEITQTPRHNTLSFGKEPKLSTEPAAQWRPIVLVIILAAAALFGAIVLARNDSVSLKGAAPNEQSTGLNESRNPPASAPSNVAETDSVSGAPQPNVSEAPDNPASGAEPAPASMPTSAAALQQAGKIQTSSRPRRVRKRKQTARPTRYFRESWRTDRRYYRPGVR